MQQHTQAPKEMPENTQAHMWNYRSVNTNKHVGVKFVLSLALLMHLLQPNNRGISTNSPPYRSAFVLLPMPFLSPSVLSSTPLSLLTWPTLYPSPPEAPYHHTNLPCLSTLDSSRSLCQRNHRCPHNPYQHPLPQRLSLQSLDSVTSQSHMS